MYRLLRMAMFLSLPTVALGAGTTTTAVSRACGVSQAQYQAAKGKPQPEIRLEEGKAVVYIFSKLSYAGLPMGCQVVSRIGLDGKWIGANCGTSYLATTITPGEHHLCADWQTKLILFKRPQPALSNLNAEAGKTYFFRARIDEQDGIANIDLEPINSDEGQALVQSSSASVSNLKH